MGCGCGAGQASCGAVMLREEGNGQGQWVPLCGRSHRQSGTVPAPTLWHHPSLQEDTGAQRADRWKLAECDVTHKCWHRGQLRAPLRRFRPPGTLVGVSRWVGTGTRMETHLLCASHLSSSALRTVLAGRVNVGSGAIMNPASDATAFEYLIFWLLISGYLPPNPSHPLTPSPSPLLL